MDSLKLSEWIGLKTIMQQVTGLTYKRDLDLVRITYFISIEQWRRSQGGGGEGTGFPKIWSGRYVLTAMFLLVLYIICI